MEPANILFIIAFIGLPIAFGIWALMSRRELRRHNPSPPQAEPSQPDVPRPSARQQPEQPTRQLPAAPPAEEETAQAVQDPQPTMQAPAQEAEQRTIQMPAATPEPEPAPEQPEPPAEEPASFGWAGSSGTTDELPVIGMPGADEEPWIDDEVISVIPPRAPESQAQPAQSPTPVPSMLVRRRPFYPPRYAGKSGGVVKRLTPLSQQRFLSPKGAR